MEINRNTEGKHMQTHTHTHTHSDIPGMLADTASDTCRETVRAMPEPYEKGEKWKGEERGVAEGSGVKGETGEK